MVLIRRHALVTVSPSAWREVAGDHPLKEVRDWAALRRPLVCRCPAPDEEGAGVALGLPLPPLLGKLRLAFLLPVNALAPFGGSTALSALDVKPDSFWRPDVAKLLQLAARYNIVPEATGSLLWQSVTGLEYLSATSDLDILWRVDPVRHDTTSLLRDLAALTGALTMRLDGEVIFPDDRGVQWRELHDSAKRGGSETVLAKSLRHGVEITTVASLFTRDAAQSREVMAS
ncbi:malonate decarboxylase-specific holo-ACP synthase [Acetobacter nitrogenifigens DSM 23921 = NBRC 105050]|uniref:Phosphoribosyl-dephospho-CoA transferase n=1 Tax=Acetobacter nitrogenifigens DSM 23921 = NBRC 105050 TaxID=1120919 RepID=A0A511X5V2_9PROT|nr:malonate decarboxylase holo-[acyl-carrier-protein] synthase [Acetobacter nitrogenifigens]GBQ98549.1 malonate decarboxylase-specific holo-ACP synthase [Acetobacter nitrogenifigens DSM 23921 = NBRC 105050]GEN58314.1 phosphoribosyl-dephospho-CoA transferase [Acetobacter nitrogenifigens DSM 23921 = NBRC 105050]